MKDFEGVFSEFIDQNEYDQAEDNIIKAMKDALYEIVRAAFKAGWTAAGGTDTKKPEESDNNE